MTTQPAPTQNAPQGERVTCSIPGPKNDRGRAKLIATLTPEGIYIWCNYCSAKHFLSSERCIAAWEKGESVQCQNEEQAARQAMIE